MPFYECCYPCNVTIVPLCCTIAQSSFWFEWKSTVVPDYMSELVHMRVVMWKVWNLSFRSLLRNWTQTKNVTIVLASLYRDKENDDIMIKTASAPLVDLHSTRLRESCWAGFQEKQWSGIYCLLLKYAFHFKCSQVEYLWHSSTTIKDTEPLHIQSFVSPLEFFSALVNFIAGTI